MRRLALPSFAETRGIITVQYIVRQLVQSADTHCEKLEKEMAKLLAIGLLCLISFEGGVCETAFVSFMGETLPNHGYVDLGRVGSAADGADSVQCHTDLESCCGTNADGASDARGNWFAPDDQQLGSAGAVYEVAGERRLDLRRNSSSGALSGMYRCEVDTVATGPGAAVREAVYVGLYANGGGIAISNPGS